MPVLPAEDEIMEDARRVLAARIERVAIRPEARPKDEERRQRSLRCCHLPAEAKTRHPSPRPSGKYVPELAAALYKDRNLTDGARCCASILAEYTHARDREARTAQITVTYLMKAMDKSRRSVQRYLRQLERAGYITVAVIHAGTRMCAGLMIGLLAPLIPRHGWKKSMKPDAPRMSQKHRLRIKYSRESWALRCMDGVFRSLMKTIPPLPDAPSLAA
jgi:Helix-turn-helix domain